MVKPFLRIFIRLLVLFVIVSSYAVIGLILFPFYKINPYNVRRVQNKILSIYCKAICVVLGIEVTIKNQNIFDYNENYLVVGNHLSYSDIFVLSSSIPTSFITSYEIKEMPLVGFLTSIAGCVYVERRNRSKREEELKDIYSSLENGVNVTLYPEATTSDGTQVLPFKKPMFIPAISLKKKILLHAINYQKIGEDIVSLENKDEIFWYGDMDFFPHLMNFLSLEKIEVELSFLEVVDTPQFSDIEELTKYCHKVVSQKYAPILS